MRNNGIPYQRAGMLAFSLALMGTLVACSPSQEDLRQWMKQEHDRVKPQVKPIPEPTRFVPQNYVQAGATDPFNEQKLTQALRRDSARADTSWLVAPELARRKEPLEAYPLDTMQMVGSLRQKGKLVALVKADTLLYQVTEGNHLGQNYGKVVKITENEVTLREIVQDAVGEWIERAATLQLQENAK